MKFWLGEVCVNVQLNRGRINNNNNNKGKENFD
jgi:hypothetical protein